MSTIDLTPLYRTMVGFDRMANMIDSAARLDGAQGYPPYNIEQIGENGLCITLAVAGFSMDELDVEVKLQNLTDWMLSALRIRFSIIVKKEGLNDGRNQLED